MSRPPRIEYPGACYYLTGRALQGRKAFEDDLDYRTFEQVLSSVVHRFNWLLQSYVLMPDHYHLVVEVPEANLSKGMRQLNGVYTQHANRRHNSEGPLFHGRFKSILFEKESFLLPICRHAALNPNRLGLTKEPSTYEQSSYGALIGQKPMPDMLHPDDLYQQVSKKPKLAQAALRAFVEQPLRITEAEGKFDVSAKLSGGGKTGQAGALRLGIARALNEIDVEAFRPALKKAGFLTRDSRVVERKKYGKAKARKSFQFSKR